MKRTLLAFLLLASCAVAVSCSPEGGSSSRGPAVLFAQTAPGILQTMVSAPTQTRFTGERQVWIRGESRGAAQTLAYSETVYADGQGGFAIEPGAVTQPILSQGQRDLFEILQRAREGFLFRYRDFAVRDLALLQQNYVVQDLGTLVTVAGRVCQELRFERRLQPAREYVVAVDRLTGLVLRWEERNGSGPAIARVEYTSFDDAPDLTGIVMHADLPSTPLDITIDNKAVLGFPLRLPGVLHGFEPVDANSITFDNRTWARVQYQDGIEPLLYLFSHRNAVPGPSVLVQPDGPEGAPVIRVYTAGAWTIAECSKNGSRFIVAGKLDEARLVETLQSAVE
ncbi:MAG: hypothetical protein IPJ77_24555 [Planctomycetes bacterium]|nr:hypothetical protein [Planctomycetota bacterium]